MSLFTWVFSMYIWMLACLPCTDEKIAFEATHMTISASNTHNSCDSLEVDLCSPLCMCACCGSLVMTSSLDYSLNNFFKLNYQPIYYKSFPLLDLSNAIWQPPKL